MINSTEREKRSFLVLTLRGPLYSDRLGLKLFGLVPFFLVATGPGCNTAGVKAHVLVLSVQQLQPECTQITASHCYISITQLLLIQISWYKYPLMIYGSDGGYGLRCVILHFAVGPGHTQTTTLQV